MSLPAYTWKGFTPRFKKHKRHGKYEGLPQPQRLLFSESTMTQVNYVDIATITEDSTYTERWGINNLYDPNSQVGGHQPYLHPEWGQLYTYYMVVKAVARITIAPNTGQGQGGAAVPGWTGGPVICHFALEHATAGSTYEDLLGQPNEFLMESPRVQSDVLNGAPYAQDAASVTLHWDLLQEPLSAGSVYADNLYTGWSGVCGGTGTGASPANRPQVGFKTLPLNSYCPGLAYKVDLLFDVVYFGPKMISY